MQSQFPFSRRNFLKSAGAAGVTGLTGLPLFGKSPAPGASGTNNNDVVKNRAPLSPNAFYLLPLGSIRPRGWLRRQLEVQANGLSGNLEESWSDVGPNSGWAGGTGESWERGPYFLDGLVPLAYLLDDDRLKTKAQRYIDWTLGSWTPSGMFGPKSNADWWPRMVMLKALIQYQEATGDPRVIPALSKYFAYQLNALPGKPLASWGKYRWQDELLSVIWQYNRTGEAKLLDLAHLLRRQGYDWQSLFIDLKYKERVTPEAVGMGSGPLPDAAMQTHGVNNGQALKMSPLWSVVSGAREDKAAVLRQLDQLQRYHGLANGMFSADEHLAGLNPSQGTELCAVVEAMFSLELSLAVLGEASLGDRLERMAFNALPGTFTDDMWAHQYDQEANQVECSLHRAPWATNGPDSNLFGLEPNFGCCTANFHQGWPKFAANLVMYSADDGLVAAAYAPCDVHTTVRGVPVRLIEETDYPFKGTVAFSLRPAEPIAFPLLLRIPQWADDARILVNGKPISGPAPLAGTFARVERTWKSGDSVEIDFPLKQRISRWHNDSVTVERGALVFALGIGESWVKLRNRGLTADWQVFPTTAWNYALSINRENVSDSFVVEENASAILSGSGPFTREASPVRLKAKARQVPDWVAIDGVAEPVPKSPVTSGEREETITLLPYAAAKLRITCFPELKD